MNETRQAPTRQRHLSRSSTDCKLGGVCGGMARYFGLDSTLVRIVAVVLAVATGGTAVWIYLAAWWLLPQDAYVDDVDDGRTHRHRRGGWCGAWCFGLGHRRGGRHGHGHGLRSHPDASTIIGLGLLAIAAMLVFHRLPFWEDDIVLALGLLAVGFGILWFGKTGNVRADDERWLAGDEDPVSPTETAAPTPEPEAPAEPTGDAGSEPIAAEPEPDEESPFEPVTPWYEIPIDRPTPPAPVPPPVPAASGRPGVWVTPTVLGLLLLGGGGIGLLVALGVDITAAQAFAGGLLLIGVGLVFGAFRGRGRGLIVPGVLLFGLLSFSSLVHIPLNAGIGEKTCNEGDETCELFIGELTYDLSGVQQRDTFTAKQGIGRLIVIVPENAQLDVDASVGAGQIVVLEEEEQNGVRAELDRVVGDEGPVMIRLILELGIGEITVQSDG